MYNDDRSDFAAPIVGFLYTAYIAIMIGVIYFCGSAEIFEDNLGINLNTYIGVAGFVIAGFNLYKAYIPEGVTFGLVALYMFAAQGMISLSAGVALLVLFAIAGVISFFRGYIDLTIINGALGVSAFFLFGWTGPKAVFIIGAILAFIAAGVSLFVAFCDWMFAQDVLDDIEGEFCCDDDECDCGCKEHGEDCDCEECKPADEPVEAEVVEETEAAENTE